MQDDKLKQLELLIAQTASRLHNLQTELSAARQKIRQQEDTIVRLRSAEAELKNLREWKKDTVSALKKLETRIDKEIAKSAENKTEVA